MADLNFNINEDVSVDDYYEAMSQSEIEEMTVLLLENGDMTLEDADTKEDVELTNELMEVFKELVNSKHLPHIRIAEEIREKYL